MPWPPSAPRISTCSVRSGLANASELGLVLNSFFFLGFFSFSSRIKVLFCIMKSLQPLGCIPATTNPEYRVPARSIGRGPADQANKAPMAHGLERLADYQRIDHAKAPLNSGHQMPVSVGSQGFEWLVLSLLGVLKSLAAQLRRQYGVVTRLLRFLSIRIQQILWEYF
jgi:hypothetical protein